MPTTLINIGSEPNDGTGNPIRTAFGTVNNNFDLINAALFAGTESTIISAYSLTSGSVTSNTFVLASTYVNANSIVGNTVTSNGNLYVSQNGAYIIGNVNIVGNLNVTGSQAASQSQQSGSPILALHYSASPLVVNDGTDIGLEWQYYQGAQKLGFLGWQNTTGTLVYMDDITDTANVISGTYGNVRFGSLLISNTTAATSNTSGALQITGGVSTLGNLYVAGNVVSTFANIGNLSVTGYCIGTWNFVGSDTIYINGSPVQTAAQSFNGGSIGLSTEITDISPTTRLGTGALRSAGGLSANGNAYIGGNLVVATTAGLLGNITGNIIGNVLKASQPYITSLGQLTSLNMGGQITSRSIIPDANNTYSLGSGSSTRWSKIWASDLDISGGIATATVTASGNISINTTGAASLRTTTAIAEVFNTTATIVRIGAAGITEFDSNTQSTSTTTGALIVTGGVGIGGNVYIRGSAGNAIVATGNIAIAGNIIPIGSNASYNIGSTTQWFNTFFGVSTQAQYADLAENYQADADYEPGTVVVFGGANEITVTDKHADHRIAGVVSTNPAYLMNAATPGTPIALRGRVPIKVAGPVYKGDLLVTSTISGYATSVGGDSSYGIKVFAKSLEENVDSGNKIIEAVIL